MTQLALVSRPSRAKPVHEVRSCQCGCGHTFVVNLHNRARKYAQDCPNADLRQLQYQKTKELARLAQMGLPAPGQPSLSTSTRRSVKVCRLCANLPERRPLEGCPRCHFPHGPPAPIVADNRADRD